MPPVALTPPFTPSPPPPPPRNHPPPRFREATNMTDRINALACLAEAPGPSRDAALEEYYAANRDKPLNMLKWLAVQVRGAAGAAAGVERPWRGVDRARHGGGAAAAAHARTLPSGAGGLALAPLPPPPYSDTPNSPAPGPPTQAGSGAPGNLAAVRSLLKHPAFAITNPNSCYSLFLGFARAAPNFHAADGSGYEFLADAVLLVRGSSPAGRGSFRGGRGKGGTGGRAARDCGACCASAGTRYTLSPPMLSLWPGGFGGVTQVASTTDAAVAVDACRDWAHRCERQLTQPQQTSPPTRPDPTQQTPAKPQRPTHAAPPAEPMQHPRATATPSPHPHPNPLPTPPHPNRTPPVPTPQSPPNPPPPPLPRPAEQGQRHRRQPRGQRLHHLPPVRRAPPGAHARAAAAHRGRGGAQRERVRDRLQEPGAVRGPRPPPPPPGSPAAAAAAAPWRANCAREAPARAVGSPRHSFLDPHTPPIPF